MIKLGISPINWSNDDDHSLGAEYSFEQCLDEMVEAGFSGCEIGHKFPSDINTLKQALSNRNLSIASKWHSAYIIDKQKHQNDLNNFKTHLNLLKSLDAKVAVVCECSYSVHSDPNLALTEKPVWNQSELDRICQHMNLLGNTAKDHGLQLVYHQHIGTGIETEQELCYLLDHTNSDNVGLLLDTGHLYFAGANIQNILNKYIGRISHVHLKDIRQDVFQQVTSQKQSSSFLSAVKSGIFTVPGDGVIDFKSVIEKLKSHNYSGWMIVEAEQDPAKANPYKYAKKAYDYLSPFIR